MRKNGVNREMKPVAGGVCAPKGFSANGIHCGIRRNKSKKDLALIVCEKRSATACVYTKNLVKGAPILVTQKHVADGYAVRSSSTAETQIPVMRTAWKLPKECVRWLRSIAEFRLPIR